MSAALVGTSAHLNPAIPQDLASHLRAMAASRPQAPYVRMAQGTLSYGQLDAQSDGLAAGLHALGVCQGDRVSVFMPNRLDFVVVWFALAKLGAVMAPLNTGFRGEALRQAVTLVGSRVAVVDASLARYWQQGLADGSALATVVWIDTQPPSGGRASHAEPSDVSHLALGGVRYTEVLNTPATAHNLPRPVIAPSDLCVLLYTSGTTGRSKAAMIAHRFVLSQAAGVIRGLGLRGDDVLYCPYPMYHLDAAVMTLAPALLLGGVAAIGERFSVSRYWEEVRAFGATVFDFMGATLTMLWKAPPTPRDREHRARLGWGVPLPDWAPQFEQRFGCRLVELYGSTEVGVVMYSPLDQVNPVGSCGRVNGPFDARLVDEDGFEVPVGDVGELVVRPLEPDVIMQGYYAMPEATLLAFRNLWFHTGDVLRRDEQGYFYFVGRRKDMVRRRGENISAAEVEAVIEGHPDILACAVIGVPSELSEEDVMVCAVKRANSALDVVALTAFCQEHLAAHMVPRYVRWLAALPTTPTDKVEKFKLVQAGVTADTWDRERA
jgi:carnitine-CoA ligase